MAHDLHYVTTAGGAFYEQLYSANAQVGSIRIGKIQEIEKRAKHLTYGVNMVATFFKLLCQKKKILSLFARSFKIWKNYGDVPLLKAELLGLKTIRPVALDELVTDGSKIDVYELLNLPPGTFGHAYAQFLLTRGLEPFTVSTHLQTIAKRRAFICRQNIVHDFLHVCLDFDTNYAGEIGVFSFLVAQKYTAWQKYFFLLALFSYPLLAPTETIQIFKNVRRGFRLGMQSAFALEFPFEKYWTMKVDTVKNLLLCQSSI